MIFQWNQWDLLPSQCVKDWHGIHTDNAKAVCATAFNLLNYVLQRMLSTGRPLNMRFRCSEGNIKYDHFPLPSLSLLFSPFVSFTDSHRLSIVTICLLRHLHFVSFSLTLATYVVLSLFVPLSMASYKKGWLSYQRQTVFLCFDSSCFWDIRNYHRIRLLEDYLHIRHKQPTQVQMRTGW